MTMMNKTEAIEVRGLTKRFGRVTAVDSVTFSIHQGELFGFLGPNGAGKTTTINILTGLARPDAGEIHISGINCTVNPKAAQHLIGVVPDESNLYPELTGLDNLCFCASLYGMRKRPRQSRAWELLDIFGLSEAAGRKFGGYSRGMKRKLAIAAGIIHNPKILFLDEPTTGIDVASARQIRQLIADLNADGTTIFLTTHYIEEAERLGRPVGPVRMVGGAGKSDLWPQLIANILNRSIEVTDLVESACYGAAMIAAGSISTQWTGADRVREFIPVARDAEAEEGRYSQYLKSYQALLPLYESEGADQ